LAQRICYKLYVNDGHFIELNFKFLLSEIRAWQIPELKKKTCGTVVSVLASFAEGLSCKGDWSWLWRNVKQEKQMEAKRETVILRS